jgi:plastocyanin
MRRAALVLAGLALAVAAPPAAGQHGAGEAAGPEARASIGFDALTPVRLDVLRGDTVMWTNVSVRAHTVTADDGSFDSGRLPSRATFSHTFDTVGEAPYHCILHPFIRGAVGVHTVLLTPPAQAAASGRAFPLTGRAALPAGSTVGIEADRGAGFVPVTTAPVTADGTFAATVVPGTTATYRAVAGAETSPPVSLLVLDRSISIRTQRGRSRVIVRTTVTPAAAGAPVVLQLFLKDRFGWWPVQRGRLDRASATRFTLRLRRRVAVRVLLTLPDGATPLAVSRTVRVGATR